MGGSTSFNGSTSKVDLGTGASIIGTGDLSVSFWMNPKSIGATNGMILDNTKFRLYFGSNARLGCQSNGSTEAATPNNSFSYKNGWVHFIVTRTSAGLTSFYKNGVLIGTPATSGKPAAGTTNLTIGNSSVANRGADTNLAKLNIFSTALTASQVSKLYKTGSCNVTPVASYALDDQPSTYIDSIGGKNGTGTDTTYSTDVPLQRRGTTDGDMASLFINGNDNYIALNSLNIVNTLPFTISIRVKFNKEDATQLLFSNKVDSTKQFTFGVRNTTNLIEGAFYDGSSYTYGQKSVQKIKKNRWYTISWVFDGSTSKIYIDSLPSLGGNSNIGGASGTDGTLTIGQRNDRTNTGTSYARFKKILVWSTALTPQQIQDLHFSNIVPGRGTTLVGEWLLNEGAGTVAYDTSGNGNNGTITGATWSSDVPSPARKLVGGNMIPNGDLSYVPMVNVATTTSARWIDGTAGGSTTNSLFSYAAVLDAANCSVGFDTSTISPLGHTSIKVNVTDATGRGRAVIGSGLLGTGSSLSISNLVLYGIKVSPSTQYTLSYYGKTLTALGSGGVISVHQHNGSGARVISPTQPAGTFSGTNNWKLKSGTFTTESTTRYLVLSIELPTAGSTQTAWFSDIQLRPTTPVVRSKVT